MPRRKGLLIKLTTYLQILLVALCFAVLLGTKRATTKLEDYLEEGIFHRQLPEKSAEGWHAWALNLQTR